MSSRFWEGDKVWYYGKDMRHRCHCATVIDDNGKEGLSVHVSFGDGDIILASRWDLAYGERFHEEVCDECEKRDDCIIRLRLDPRPLTPLEDVE